ncbi:MAG TPA: hypothetical protein VFA70_11130, partial [Dehalococcoidia bacterium]|nr:hypothetical protein [Dehalococcoidia bacterium]
PQGGAGYWAFYSADTDVPLPAGSNAPVTVTAPAGAWLLVGNPSGTQPATVSGADAAWKYNATTGGYVPGTVLNPGEGAWVISMAGGRITVAPGAAPAQAPAAATPSPSPTPRPASTPPPTTAPVSQPTMTPPYHYPVY